MLLNAQISEIIAATQKRTYESIVHTIHGALDWSISYTKIPPLVLR